MEDRRQLYQEHRKDKRRAGMPVVAFMKAVVGEGVQPGRLILANKTREWQQGLEASLLLIASDDVTDDHRSCST